MKADLERGSKQIVEGFDETTKLLSARTLGSIPHDDTVIIKYDPVELTSWRALFRLKGSVFMNRDLWVVVSAALMLAVGVGIPIALFAKNPETYDTAMISDVIKVVTVALAFLLGLFVNTAMTRWWDIVKTFESLFGACKKLQLVLVNFDASSEIRTHVARRLVLSVEMLRFEKVVPKLPDGSGDPAAWGEKFDQLEADGGLTTDERSILQGLPEQERSLFTWGLVGKAVKKVREGDAGRAMDYRTIYSAVQDGTATVGRLKSAANFHFPFLYVHMLAWMVHLVNFLTAVGTGITIGLISGRYMNPAHGISRGQNFFDFSEVIKALLFLYIQVFLYQAFFSIGAALSFPIVPVGHGAMYRLPLAEMIEALRKTLGLINKLADEKQI